MHRYLSRQSIEKWRIYRFLLCSQWKNPTQSRPHTMDPKNEVLENLPRYDS
jgi:hypothetical protein